jgi:hypothetical protein
MEGKLMNPTSIRIAELFENIDKVNSMLDLHQKTTQDEMMIQQYKMQRQEFADELEQLLVSYKMTIGFAA